ncbi:lipopolysaccharide biosynthesis protein [Enterobacter sp. RHBSTW-00175]|uniref:lipopolysaccharide biosynthesis protein n=1 Tax=Enterobacter sp. RHBSTW-00175 TaxID=2742639 RepID=UPI0015E921AC|nr:capsular biosynthesis protein [Enterobacter sp. RHBSTW-00175]QMR78260.1 capsular biosynthesis protein [Enterobacter sp. RHBSTW-00175]
MNLIRSISSIASSSVLSQLIGAFSVWLISHRYGMAEVGHYAMIYSNVLIGAQVCMFASQLLIPRQEDHQLGQNVVFCVLQSLVMAIPWAVITGLIFNLNIAFLYLLTFGYALVLVAENLSLRGGNYPFLTFQRIAVSLVVAVALLVMPNPMLFYLAWMVGILLLISGCLIRLFNFRSLTLSNFSLTTNARFLREHWQHISRVGSAEVLAIASNNLPTMLINIWFSPLVAGYFSVVSRFCLSPVMIIGNAVRNSIFSKWSMDFRNNTFNYPEYKKVRLMLMGASVVCILGIWIFYPLVMRLGFSQEWLNSIPTSRYMLPYLFAALAVSPLTVIELIFGSRRYFLRIQIEQILIIAVAFIALPKFGVGYQIALLTFSVLTSVRYLFILIKMNQRAKSLWVQEQKICS